MITFILLAISAAGVAGALGILVDTLSRRPWWVNVLKRLQSDTKWQAPPLNRCHGGAPVECTETTSAPKLANERGEDCPECGRDRWWPGEPSKYRGQPDERPTCAVCGCEYRAKPPKLMGGYVR